MVLQPLEGHLLVLVVGTEALLSAPVYGGPQEAAAQADIQVLAEAEAPAVLPEGGHPRRAVPPVAAAQAAVEPGPRAAAAVAAGLVF